MSTILEALLVQRLSLILIKGDVSAYTASFGFGS